MGFWNRVFGTEEQATQEIQFAEKQRAYEEALARRVDAGTMDRDTADELGRQVRGERLEDVDRAAAIGALEGATEIAYNPSQWWRDVVDGYDVAGDTAAEAAKSADRFSFDLVGKILKSIPVTVWVAGGLALFLYLGGATWLKGALKK